MERKYDDEYWFEDKEGNMDWQQKGFWFACGMIVAVVICATVGLMIP